MREEIAEVKLRSAIWPSPSWIHDFPCETNLLPNLTCQFEMHGIFLHASSGKCCAYDVN